MRKSTCFQDWRRERAVVLCLLVGTTLAVPQSRGASKRRCRSAARQSETVHPLGDVIVRSGPAGSIQILARSTSATAGLNAERSRVEAIEQNPPSCRAESRADRLRDYHESRWTTRSRRPPTPSSHQVGIRDQTIEGMQAGSRSRPDRGCAAAQSGRDIRIHTGSGNVEAKGASVRLRHVPQRRHQHRGEQQGATYGSETGSGNIEVRVSTVACAQTPGR